MKLSFIKSLGPGILYAGAAVGVSHLVQSTRAGASFGISMLLVVVLANFLKYPFFEAGPRYAAATGKHLLQGYKSLGKWAVLLFLGMTLSTMFIIQAAVTIVTAGLAQNLFQTTLSVDILSCLILLICGFILFKGRYQILEKIMKYVIVMLSITSIVAVSLSFGIEKTTVPHPLPFDFSNPAHLAFLIAFVGWMPAPIDISVWHSMWALVKNKQNGPQKSKPLVDFNIGYWGTAVLAIFFVLLGKNMLYGTGVELAPQAGKFADQLIRLYTDALGEWSYPIIALAAFTTMFSTTLTVFDGLSRVMVPAIQEIAQTSKSPDSENRSYKMWLIIIGIGASSILVFFLKNMRVLVDIATTVSFLTAPVFAILNYKVMLSKEVGKAYRFSLFTNIVAVLGIVLLLATSVYFIYSQYH